MSLREEEREKNNCPSRGLGLGLAAAAIGVGVGAALYYFINKREENPTAAGSTTQNWSCESPQTLYIQEQNLDDSYSTISEHSTTDTSINEDSYSSKMSSDDSESETSYDSETQTSDLDSSDSDNSNGDDSYMSVDSEFEEWDLTASLEYPSIEPPQNSLWSLTQNLIKSNHKPKSRERSWTLEECSICFDVILRDQEVMSLPCTHNFHSKCILPWLQEQQTCPNCRKSID